jgi:P4 family phage/plasmid primase-like protien
MSKQYNKQSSNTQQNLESALQHAKAGYAVFPARPCKRPYISDWQKLATTDAQTIRNWWKLYPDAAPGIPTGRKNNLVVLDVDRKNGKDGFEGLRSMGLELENLPIQQCKTPSNGAHFYFTWVDGINNSASHLPSGIDVRGEGGYVLASGAVIAAGEYKAGSQSLVNDLIGLSDWPEILMPQSHEPSPNRRSGNRIPLETLDDALMAIPNTNPDRDWWASIGFALHFETDGSERGLALWHRWSSLYEGYDEEHTGKLWESCQRKTGDVRTGKTILAEAARHGWREHNADVQFDETGRKYKLDEDGIIRAFTDKHLGNLCYDHNAGRWFKFDGNVWRKEDTKLAHHYARELATSIAETDPKQKALRKVNSWEAIERGARTVREFAVVSEKWDQNPYLLGTPGGTLDLKTGELRPSNPEEYISRLTGTFPIPLAEFEQSVHCPEWMNFLNAALGEDEQAIRFLQQWGGYCLTGDTKEQKLLFIYGVGKSGKSTTLNTLADILGEYAIAMASETLTLRKHDAHPEEIARLHGPRLAWASETEQDKRWAENRIKSMTGGDTLTGRFMRGNTFEFTPSFKLTIVGNHAPSLSNVDDALKRRFLILPFNNPPEKVDLDLHAKLRHEHPGILSWFVQGCLDWQKNGLLIPDLAREATDSYFSNQDTFGLWLEECCNIGESESTKMSDIWESWNSFAHKHGESPGSKQRAFPEILQQRGFKRIRYNCSIRGRGYQGLSLKKDRSTDFDHQLI